MDAKTQHSGCPPFQWAFLHPRYWLTWLGVFFAALLVFIPFQIRDKLACWLGTRFARLNNRAKQRAAINIAQCFPEKSELERETILLESYQIAACTFLHLPSLMVRSKSYLAAQTIFHQEHILTDLLAQKCNVILLVPHTWSIEFTAVQLASRGFPLAAMVKPQANALADWLLNVQRLRYGGYVQQRSDGIKPYVRAIRNGYLAYYLPDEDHGPESSVFVPFLGATKATLSGIGTLARLSKAVVVPMNSMYNRQTGQVEIFIESPLADFPTGDPKQDAERMNASLERMILRDPSQYMWNLNILRSRPDGSELY